MELKDVHLKIPEAIIFKFDLPIGLTTSSFGDMGSSFSYDEDLARCTILARNLGTKRFVKMVPEHKDRIIIPSLDGRFANFRACDSLMLTDSEKDTLLIAPTGDCPYLVSVIPGLSAVSMTHLGWRSLAAGLLEKSVSGFARYFKAAIGIMRFFYWNGICESCYPFPDPHPALEDDLVSGRLNFADAIKRRLSCLGAMSYNIFPTPIDLCPSCTTVDTGERIIYPFYSHKARKNRERNAIFVIF